MEMELEHWSLHKDLLGWLGRKALATESLSDNGQTYATHSRMYVNVTFDGRYWQLFPKSNIASLPRKINVLILM